MDKINTKTALLEIGVEELPTSYINPALEQMEQLTGKILTSHSLNFTNIKTYATPRRLVLFIYELCDKSKDTTEEILGPSIKVAKDSSGSFTKAALGFAAKNALSAENLKTKTTNKGEYLCFTKKINGEKTQNILGTIFPEIIQRISFPKTMVWDESGFKFARPIRSILALFGMSVVKFRVAGIISSNWTIGLHTYDAKKIKIDMPENYISILRNKSVIVDQNQRRKELKNSINHCINHIGTIVPDEDLIDEVNYLVEYPCAICCSFDKKYLNLPQEILTVCMKKSQKCFSVNDRTGKFSNNFVGIKNGTSAYQDMVQEGYEKVVLSRLADANFFYNNDLKSDLESNIEKLKGLIFHKEIGTVYEKVLRIKQIALLFNKEFNLNIDDTLIEKATMLSKADLLTEIVFEYPELQGTMGKIYAIKLKENSEIAQAIQEHYFPLNAYGDLPNSKLSSVLSMADKIDTLVASFAIGLEPSGSIDPYGLRRAAIGFIRVATKIIPNSDLSQTIDKVFAFLPESIKNNKQTINHKGKLINFLYQRVTSILEREGFQTCEVKSVTSRIKTHGIKNLGSLKPKLSSLQKTKQKGDFISVAAIFKRINNILNQAAKQNTDISTTVDKSLLIEEAEINLFKKALASKELIEQYIKDNNFDAVFDKALELKTSVDSFFDKAMIMTKEKNIKLNRLAMLMYIKNIFLEFIDFSVLSN